MGEKGAMVTTAASRKAAAIVDGRGIGRKCIHELDVRPHAQSRIELGAKGGEIYGAYRRSLDNNRQGIEAIRARDS